MTTNSDKDTKKKEAGAKPQELFSAVGTVTNQLETIEKFIARRFDEISMEINATSQQIDMNEEDMSRRFGDIMEVLKAVSYSGDGSTAANAGVELDAVVDMTEKAANTILDAADRISERIKASQEAGDDESKQNVLEQISTDIEEIFMACSFQDITGQRIRNTLENLREIEDRLGSALKQIGIKVDEVSAEDHAAIANKLSDQGEIDNLFQSEKEKEEGSKTVSQDDIDDMF
jgi:chemotaxis regulatin CheY-phosphate phosphatase CheZ